MADSPTFPVGQFARVIPMDDDVLQLSGQVVQIVAISDIVTPYGRPTAVVTLGGRRRGVFSGRLDPVTLTPEEAAAWLIAQLSR